MTNNPAAETDASRLKQIIERRKVVYEVIPASTFIGTVRRQIGFDLFLYGTHGDQIPHVNPGCPHCVSVWRDLESIATAVVPKDNRMSISRVEPFDHMLHQSKSRRYRNDVELVITIRHKNDFEDPLDSCESHCLRDITDSLKALGVRERSWNSSRPQWMGLET